MKEKKTNFVYTPHTTLVGKTTLVCTVAYNANAHSKVINLDLSVIKQATAT